tara:strand:+ start:1561 stop:2499 length:939 start_codon:yes stop_codon:yes gene_type:complete
MTLEDMFRCQGDFNKLFFDSDDLSDLEKEEITKSLTLALHTEVSELISAINFKDHRQSRSQIDREKILYESIDVFRYLVAILNLWDVNSEQFISAFDDKDLFLHTRHQMESVKWSGQPVLIFDLDDVICEFRETFINWLKITYDIDADINSTEYYTTAEVKEAGLNPEAVFEEFVANRQLRNISPNKEIIEAVNKLHNEGYWIQILTARPDDSLVCKYDTFQWLKKSGLKYHRVDFSPEKYRWLTKTDYYANEKIVCAIDDSAKHSAEYAKHSVITCSPSKSYNAELSNLSNVRMYKNATELISCIKNISLS